MRFPAVRSALRVGHLPLSGAPAWRAARCMQTRVPMPMCSAIALPSRRCAPPPPSLLLMRSFAAKADDDAAPAKKKKKKKDGVVVDAVAEEEEEDEDKKKEKKPSKWAQMKTMFKEYKYVFVCYWAATWTAGFIPCYAALDLGGVDGVALFDALQDYMALETRLDISMVDPRFVNALIAMEINELFEIVRLPAVIATTPKVAAWWRSRGGKGGGGGDGGGGAAAAEEEPPVEDLLKNHSSTAAPTKAA